MKLSEYRNSKTGNLKQRPITIHRSYTRMSHPVIKIFRGLLTLIVLLLVPALVAAQQSSDSIYKNNTIVLPAIGSSPETSLMFGGVGIYQFRMGPSPATRSSSLMIAGIYTLNSQLSVGFSPSLILENESWIIEGNYSYNYFPEMFWGVGPFVPDENEMELSYRQIYLEQSALRQIYPNLFVGPQLRWNKNYSIQFEDPDGNDIAPPQVVGADDYSTTGLGLTIRWDERNSTITPTQHQMVNLSVMANPSWLSSIDTYTAYLFDARKYYDLSDAGKSVLAFQLFTKFTSGHPPFKDMALLGGESILRGYYEGRLRDRHGAQLQAEFRQKIYGRLGFTVFTSAGQVWPSFNEMALDHTRFTAGGGLRFNLNKQDPTNIRIDYGIGRNTSGLYITIGEAF